MSDSEKSRDELLEELRALRAQLGQDEADASHASPPSDQNAPAPRAGWTRREALGTAAWVAPVILSVSLGAPAQAQTSRSDRLRQPLGSTVPTPFPTGFPTGFPTSFPTGFPTSFPTGFPTSFPTGFPTSFPTSAPTSAPTVAPPTSAPTSFPTFPPTTAPTPPGQIFADGFESGDTRAWSSSTDDVFADDFESGDAGAWDETTGGS